MEAKNTPRGRPRKFDEDRILDIARDLFWRQGYEGTSIKHLTEATGLTPPSLYAAFGSKEGLFVRALDRYTDTFGTKLMQGMAEEQHLKRAFSRLLRNCVDQFTSKGRYPGCMISLGVLVCAPENEHIAEDLAQRRLRVSAQLLDRLKADRHQLPDGTDLVALANFFAMAIEGLSIQAHDGLDKNGLDKLSKFIMAGWPS
ncbi:TetR/AcrR family transcriptional regulator [Ruegeria sp. MALMAid1280]|uniref:TetR/AcrR family transcriptional regulator n=1 Tax=Ruegeria sp. MALMAid1280 TaxID=3411634 RepID=UPI003BA12C8A